MEDFAGVIVMIIIGAIVSSINKANKKQAASKPTVFPAQQTTAAPASKPTTSADVQPQRAEVSVRPAIPTVHTHLDPDCDVHDASGSLAFTSTEGKDPCHEDELTMQRTTLEPSEEKPGLTLDWTGDALVKSFVMQEVLTRPCQRRAR